MSIWSPVHPTSILTGRNRARITLGHYAAVGYGDSYRSIAPHELKSFTLEITDTQYSTMFRSPNLELAKLNWLCPHPANYKLAWSMTNKEFSMFVWRLIPPTQNHVALGMICTVTNDPPPLTLARCVPKGWTIRFKGTVDDAVGRQRHRR